MFFRAALLPGAPPPLHKEKSVLHEAILSNRRPGWRADPIGQNFSLSRCLPGPDPAPAVCPRTPSSTGGLSYPPSRGRCGSAGDRGRRVERGPTPPSRPVLRREPGHPAGEKIPGGGPERPRPSSGPRQPPHRPGDRGPAPTPGPRHSFPVRPAGLCTPLPGPLLCHLPGKRPPP